MFHAIAHVEALEESFHTAASDADAATTTRAYGPGRVTEIETVVVTRHQALVAYLIETGAIPADAPVLAHATAEQVRGKHVIGVLPLHLAAEAALVTEIPLDLPPQARGRELSLDEVRQFAGPARRYTVRAARVS